MNNQPPYTLAHDEFVLLKCDRVHYNSGSFLGESTADELILTNKRVIHVIKGFFGPKSVDNFALNAIKVFDGKCQVKLEKSTIGRHEVTFYLQDRQETFAFESKITALQFANETTKALTSNNAHPQTILDSDPVLSTVATTVADGVNNVASVFGLNINLEKFGPKQPDIVQGTCPTCSGPVYAPAGQVATCTCCGEKVRL